MNLLTGMARVAAVGEVTTAALGGVGGAAVGSMVGGLKGAVVGAAEGARRGRHSTPAAVLTMGAIAVTGVVQWPVVAAVGGAVLVLDQFAPAASKTDTPRTGVKPTDAAALTPAGAGAAGAPSSAGAKSTPGRGASAARRRRAPTKTTKSSSSSTV